MLQTFSVLKSAIKLKQSVVQIDNVIFKLHYRATVAILMAATVLVTSQQYIGEHIKCICDKKSVPERVMNTYCFFTSTYTVVNHLNASYLEKGLIAHPGVGPLPAYSTEKIIRHAYYQWVPFVLFFQSICFYLPHYIWKKKEGGRLKTLVIGLQLAWMSIHDKSYQIGKSIIPSKNEKQQNFKIIKQAFISKVHNQPWSYWLITCEILNLINLIFNIILTNQFLGGHFYQLGPAVIAEGLESDIDILDEVFPKVTKCDFYKFGPSGNIQKLDALCVMALNVVNEKIYLVLWFWFVILFFLTLGGLLWRFLTFILHSRSVSFNSYIFSYACSGTLNFKDVATVTKSAHFADWLFLYYLAKSLDGNVFKELFISLAKDLDEDNEQYSNTSSEPIIDSIDNVDFNSDYDKTSTL